MNEEINFVKTVYDKSQYEKLVDTSFSQINPDFDLQQSQKEEPTVLEFWFDGNVSSS